MDHGLMCENGANSTCRLISNAGEKSLMIITEKGKINNASGHEPVQQEAYFLYYWLLADLLSPDRSSYGYERLRYHF